jgi:hypothetical protein
MPADCPAKSAKLAKEMGFRNDLHPGGYQGGGG